MATSKPTTLSTELVDKFFPTSTMVGGHNVELRSFIETVGHDDSLPYQAKVFVDGKEVAVAYNDGWGGETNVRVTKEKAYPLMNEVEKYIRENKEQFPLGEYGGHKLYHTNLSSVCDSLADNCAIRKDIKKHADKRMLIYDPNTKGMFTLSFKGMGSNKISDFANVPQFRKIWGNAVARYESEGKVILNNVFPSQSATKKVG